MLCNTKSYERSVVIFGANEAATIADCVRSVQANCTGEPAHITVMLNGSSDASLDIVRKLPPGPLDISVFAIEAGDKANAINQFVHTVRPVAQVYFLLDAYVTLSPGALTAATEALRGDPHAHAVSGYPLNGRSAQWFREALRAGAINGNFSGVRSAFLDRLVAERLKLPLRIYRTDGLFGSIAAHDFDCLSHPWDSTRMIAAEGATYRIRPLSPTKWRDVRRQFRREIKQARGNLEVAAIQSIIYRDGYAGLPADADEMIRAWLASHRYKPTSFRSKLFLPLALRELVTASAAPPPERLEPRLVYQWPPADEALQPSIRAGRPQAPAGFAGALTGMASISGSPPSAS